MLPENAPTFTPMEHCDQCPILKAHPDICCVTGRICCYFCLDEECLYNASTNKEDDTSLDEGITDGDAEEQ